MKASETELQNFYKMFTHGIEISHQFEDTEILSQLRALVPLFSPHYPMETARSLVKWFREPDGFGMKWSHDPKLPRYNDIPTLLKTRVGRCGEWAILYTGFLNALGIRARYVLDWTDHVWTEVLETDKTWRMIDSTLIDMWGQDYFYEQNWGKKFSYIIAFGQYIQDVTQGYTQQWQKVRKRRKLDPIPDMLISTYNGAKHWEIMKTV